MSNEHTGRMAYRPYREAILSGEFVPSARALEVDAILDEVKAGGPEKYPEYYTWLGQMGWVLTHPLQSQNSLTEHTAWVNSGLGRANFGPNKTRKSNSYSGSFANANDVASGVVRDANGTIIPQEAINAGYTFNQGTGLLNIPRSEDNSIPFHPETYEPGRWKFYGGLGWMNADAWQGPRTHYPDGLPVFPFAGARQRAPDAPSPQATAPAGQQVGASAGQAQDNRPQWSNLNPMGGMLTSIPMMQSPFGLNRNQLINSLLGK